MNYELTKKQIKKIAAEIEIENQRGVEYFSTEYLMKLLIESGVSKNSFKTDRDVTRFMNVVLSFPLSEYYMLISYNDLNNWFASQLTK